MPGYWETLFDPRFLWDSDWKQRRDLIDEQQELDALRQNQSVATAQLHQRIRDLSITVMALVELLAEDGKLDPQELRARVQAAVIGETHERREVGDASQDAWDAAKPKR